MKLEDVAAVVDGLPWMKRPQARVMTDLIMAQRPRNILELGFKHGVSTCYMAGALDELGGGHVTTVDLTSARELSPNADELLGRLGLSDYVTVHYEETSYIWRLLEMLERSPRPQFDFCYLDGAHNWETDGFAFYLVDKLLAPGATLVLDDIDWSYEKSPTLQDEPWVQAMPRDQYEMRQLEKVFRLLVCEHPNYTDFRVEDGVGYARKTRVDEVAPVDRVVTEVKLKRVPVGLTAALLQAGKALQQRLPGLRRRVSSAA